MKQQLKDAQKVTDASCESRGMQDIRKVNGGVLNKVYQELISDWFMNTFQPCKHSFCFNDS